MGLRAKVALMLVAAIVPISLLFSMWRISSEHRSFLERRAERAASRMQRAPLHRCLNHPEQWRLERRGFVAFAYDPQFVSRNSEAPEVPPGVAAKLRNSDDEPAHVWFLPAKKYLGVTAVRVADDGPCAIVVFGWTGRAVPPRVFRTALEQTVGLAAILGLLGVLVAFPIVRRIRRLEDAVREAQHGAFDADLRGNDEINHLADAFAETFAAVRERERALEEYIDNTTHDLAIPLTVLQHRLRRVSDEVDSDDLRVALEESHYIAALIANMRTAAQLQATDALDLTHEVDLSALVERVGQRHQPIADQKQVDLNWAVPERPFTVTGEPTLAEQALSNLVQNAVQYNSAGGHVSVVLEPTDTGFELRVADDGPGIPEALREDVLRRGVRDDAARTRNEGGQGFGLAIVRRVCELHDWSLELESDAGLTVIVRG